MCPLHVLTWFCPCRFRHVVSEQLSRVQHAKLACDVSAHAAKLSLRSLTQTPPPVPFCSLQIRREHSSVPVSSHTIPNFVLSSAHRWTHRRQLQHHTSLPRQAPCLSSNHAPPSQERRTPPFPSPPTGAVRREAGPAPYAIIPVLLVFRVLGEEGRAWRVNEETRIGGCARRIPPGFVPLRTRSPEPDGDRGREYAWGSALSTRTDANAHAHPAHVESGEASRKAGLNNGSRV